MARNAFPHLVRLMHFAQAATCLCVVSVSASELAASAAADPRFLPPRPPPVADILGNQEPVYGVDLDARAFATLSTSDALWRTNRAVKEFNPDANQRTWFPGNTNAARSNNPGLGSVLGSYASDGEYARPDGSAAPGIANNDPLLYKDPSLLGSASTEKALSVLRGALNPIKNEQTGEVRFSVFGFGSFSINRPSSDGRAQLQTYEIHDERSRSVVEPSTEIRMHSTEVTITGDGDSEFHSDVLWLWDAARHNWLITGILFLLLVAAMRLASRLYGDPSELGEVRVAPAPEADKPRHRLRKKRRRQPDSSSSERTKRRHRRSSSDATNNTHQHGRTSSSHGQRRHRGDSSKNTVANDSPPNDITSKDSAHNDAAESLLTYGSVARSPSVKFVAQNDPPPATKETSEPPLTGQFAPEASQEPTTAAPELANAGYQETKASAVSSTTQALPVAERAQQVNDASTVEHGSPEASMKGQDTPGRRRGRRRSLKSRIKRVFA